MQRCGAARTAHSAALLHWMLPRAEYVDEMRKRSLGMAKLLDVTLTLAFWSLIFSGVLTVVAGFT